MQIETSEIQMRVKGGFVNLHLNPQQFSRLTGPLQNQVTWYGINYAGTQVTQLGLS